MDVSMPTFSRRAIEKARDERRREDGAEWLDKTIALAAERGMTLGQLAESIGMTTVELVDEFATGVSFDALFGIVEALDMRLSEWVTQVVGD